jgi:hypothetical protein
LNWSTSAPNSSGSHFNRAPSARGQSLRRPRSSNLKTDKALDFTILPTLLACDELVKKLSLFSRTLLHPLRAESGTELPVLKPFTCMPGIYGEADTDLGGSGVDKMDGN